MIRKDEDALICDLAETYQIYDYKRLPLQAVATFAIGLSEDSRIKMKLRGQKVTFKTMLMAALHDQLNLLLWSKTKDGAKGINKPKLITQALTGGADKGDGEAFDSGKAFEERRKELLGGNDGN